MWYKSGSVLKNGVKVIVNWPVGNDPSSPAFSRTIGRRVIGRYLYIPLKPELDFTDMQPFQKIYLDKNISKFNWTQYIQKYERKKMPIFGNRWIDVYAGGHGQWPVEEICISFDDFCKFDKLDTFTY